MSEAKLYNPRYPQFKEDEATRPDFDTTKHFHYTKTVKPDWRFGEGSNSPHKHGAQKHISFDPYEPGRSGLLNYKLLTTAIVPRPIAFVSTRSKDGKLNLAPFSYFNYFNHDPPIFAIGFGTNITKPNGGTQDTVRNLYETGECVLNIISESFIEAANSCAVTTLPDVSEWDISGLTPVFDCKIQAPRVKEAIFSIEAKVDMFREYQSRSIPGKISGTLVLLEGTNFWAREDSINEDKSCVDPKMLRAVGRYGGIGYTRSVENFELPIPDFEVDVAGYEGVEAAKKVKTNRQQNRVV